MAREVACDDPAGDVIEVFGAEVNEAMGAVVSKLLVIVIEALFFVVVAAVEVWVSPELVMVMAELVVVEFE